MIRICRRFSLKPVLGIQLKASQNVANCRPFAWGQFVSLCKSPLQWPTFQLRSWSSKPDWLNRCEKKTWSLGTSKKERIGFTKALTCFQASNQCKHQETQCFPSRFFSDSNPGIYNDLYSILSMTTPSHCISLYRQLPPCCALEEARSLQDQTWGQAAPQGVTWRFGVNSHDWWWLGETGRHHMKWFR